MYVLHPGWGFEEEMADEMSAIETHFPNSHGHLIGDVPAGSVVLPRFRALPFGQELVDELAAKNCRTLNGWAGHRWCADLGQWYPVLKDFTPESWRGAENIPIGENGPFIVKGETNSRRGRWFTHCFCESRADVGPTVANLMGDSLIQHQQIWVRKFVPLHRYFDDVAGMPINEEYRCFFYGGRMIAGGFYWANHLEQIRETCRNGPDVANVPLGWLTEIGNKIRPYADFVCVDVAVTADADWIVVEVNDGQMAGVCGVNPDTLYGMLKLVVR